MNRCAILGGEPVRNFPVPWTNTMGEEEKKAVLDVMKTGCLSDFLANSGEKFLGGKKVRELEDAFCNRFKSSYAISVNSATTALHTAIAACGIGPGDEVIVSPYTMVASASSILMNCAVPIFADVDKATYTLNPDEIEKWITPHTKAIMTVNLFGLPSEMLGIMSIAKKHGLYVIEDNSQSPGATINGKEAGTFADIGVFSLNYHKIIHSGEGGVLVTNNKELAKKCRLIRNHGEIALDEENDFETIALGSNIRMSELHASIGIEQLKKLDDFLNRRRQIAKRVTDKIICRDGLEGVFVPEGYTHSYYVYPIKFKEEVWGMSREVFTKALNAEGFPVGNGYVKPIYLINLYKHKHVFNKTEYPFAFIKDQTQRHEKGLCPVVEQLYEKDLMIADVCREPYNYEIIDQFFRAIDKIWEEKEFISSKIME